MSPALKLKEKIEAEIKKRDERSIVDLVDTLVHHAHSVRASDIHIDPTEKNLRVRLRIDGVLQDTFAFPSEIHNEIISRIKILSGLRTDEHQAAQDGRFRVTIDELGPIDIRVSIAPTYHGENVVLRLLADRTESFTVETLGFNKEDQEKILKAIRRPFGMILCTGPTGSGKTTTLYTLIKKLNTPEVSIITIEDPIEYAISGIEQIQVNRRTDLTFANGLRSVLRQDPDTIMVGEIRDAETATLAVNTALTGHLLFSTLHTNDAATTLPRLLDMGIEPYLISSTVNVVIAQRLVRQVCPKCSHPYNLSKTELQSLKEILSPKLLERKVNFIKGGGCDYCADSGYHGRININEVLVVDDDIREAFLRKASSTEIKKIAIGKGMTPLIDSGFDKAAKGLTTIEEVLRVIHE